MIITLAVGLAVFGLTGLALGAVERLLLRRKVIARLMEF
jgi:hypothetical protein